MILEKMIFKITILVVIELSGGRELKGRRAGSVLVAGQRDGIVHVELVIADGGRVHPGSGGGGSGGGSSSGHRFVVMIEMMKIGKVVELVVSFHGAEKRLHLLREIFTFFKTRGERERTTRNDFLCLGARLLIPPAGGPRSPQRLRPFAESHWVEADWVLIGPIRVEGDITDSCAPPPSFDGLINLKDEIIRPSLYIPYR